MSVVKGQLSVVVHALIAVFFILVIVFLNFTLVRYLFQGEFSQNMGSIEISYIQMAKFWVGSASGGWQPLWYLGYPWHVFYTPLLPALEVLAHQVLDFSFVHAYRVIVGAGYILAPASLFLFVWQISKSKTGALISALIYSFVPSIIAFLFTDVRADTLSALAEPRRFAILVRWGEGPHILALVFLPLFGFFFLRYFGKRTFLNLTAPAFFLGLTALTNAIALWATLLLLLAIILGEISKKGANIIGLIKSTIGFSILTFGLIAFWFNIPFISTFFREGTGVLDNWLSMMPWGLIPLGAVFVIIFLVVQKIDKYVVGFAVSALWFLMLFAIVYIYYASGESRLEYVPQALRLNTEVDMALAILFGVLVSKIYLLLARGFERLKFAIYPLAFLLSALPIIALFFWWNQLRQVLPDFTKPLSATGDIKSTAEYQTAIKLQELTSGTDQRVLAPGNYGFWLNYFADVPQLRGALYQSSTHFWPDHAYYQITNGSDGNISLAWLKITNIGKLVYTTIGSKESFKDYKVPVDKFRGVLKEILSENGDIYFDVPLKNDNLAKVVDASAFRQIRKPTNAIDSEPIYQYVSWLEQKADKKLRLSKISNSRYKIGGELGDGEAVLFQQTYDSGWRVKTRGWKVVKDPLDFMVLVPKRAGSFEIELVYGKPLSVWLGYLITLATIGVIVREFVKAIRRHNST